MPSPSSADWVSRLRQWAEHDPNVRLALLVGSQARTETPADRFSDIDLVIFARDPESILSEDRWIDTLGPHWTSHVELNALGSGKERRVVFQDGQDVDFAVFPVQDVPALLTDVRAATILRKGFRVLADKEGVEISVPGGREPPALPSAAEFSDLANDYWFHLVWAAKKLRRGERLTALQATNGYLFAMLVRAARWHALALNPTGQEVWHSARFFERWADPRVIRDLPHAVAGYDDRSIEIALRTHRTMFLWLSDELAGRLSFPRPLKDAEAVSRYLDRLTEGEGSGGSR
jgi:aminoglycoside 6-adenylyltransferase